MQDCAVVGMGLVSCLGVGVAEHFSALSAARSGISQLSFFDSDGFRPIHVGEVPNSKLRDGASSLLLPFSRLRHRKELLVVAALSEAWREFGGSGGVAGIAPERVAVVLGTGLFFGLEPNDWILQERGRPVFRMFDSSSMAEGDHSLDRVVEVTGSKGIQIELNSACAASGHALGVAMLLIRGGHADVVVAGGVDAMINPIGVGGFQVLGVTSTRSGAPEKACRPFDVRRDGTVIGEGSAVLILEAAERAKRRQQPIWGYVEGAGFSADGFSVTAPHTEGAGARRAMQAALHSADRKPVEIDYLNAHGTATRLNDLAEVKAIQEVFGRPLTVSSTKPLTGHLVAAAGILEAAITLLTLNSGLIFPTLNLEHPDPAFELDFVRLQPRHAEVSCAMSNSFGLGGQNSTVVLGSPEVHHALDVISGSE